MKQVIILRTDLNMSAGKAAAQASHASLMAFLQTAQKYPQKIEAWFKTGQGKIILEINSEDELKQIYTSLSNDDTGKDICYLVKDSGLTELKGMEYTALGIGPFDKDYIDRFTRHLKLYR
ncbi:MAG: peptidyl-tRNA hydrolase 2, mitochondrial-like [Mucilaginibacter sp.]|jgi:PTH2 family peptidyl-tRNA hydrolase|nr:peptidyl-tRNA hydrolase 2, mitochondrial-like [Mucilaginibacter sp.]